jgi:hypothetical protein
MLLLHVTSLSVDVLVLWYDAALQANLYTYGAAITYASAAPRKSISLY